MIDLLIRWPDRPTAIECGKLLGTTTEQEDGSHTTATLFGAINLALLGSHSYIADDSDPEAPVVETVPGWWFLVRVPEGFDVSAILDPIPANLRPAIVWSSDMRDEHDQPIDRPPITEAPTTRWA